MKKANSGYPLALVDIHCYPLRMAKKPLKRKRPGVLVRFYPTDLQLLNEHCAKQCTPRENFVRRLVLAALQKKTPRRKVATAT